MDSQGGTGAHDGAGPGNGGEEERLRNAQSLMGSSLSSSGDGTCDSDTAASDSPLALAANGHEAAAPDIAHDVQNLSLRNSPAHPMDAQGLELLRDIFGPDASREELEAIHQTRLESLNESFAADDADVSGSNESERRSSDASSMRSSRNHRNRPRRQRRRRGVDVALPDDFLAIPPSAMVLLPKEKKGSSGGGGDEWQSIVDLEFAVHTALGIHPSEFSRVGEFFTAVLERHSSNDSQNKSEGGLGMTLRQYDGIVCVHALPSSSATTAVWSGPAHDAGIRVGDEILGINGVAVPQLPGTDDECESTLPFVVELLRCTPDPVVIHLRRGDGGGRFEVDQRGGDAAVTDNDTIQQVQAIHPLAKLLRERGILRTIGEEKDVTEHIDEYTERTRQWEATSTLCIDGSYNLCRNGHAPGTRKDVGSGNCTPSTPVQRPRRLQSATKSGITTSFASPPISSKQNESLRHETPAQAIRTKGVYPGQTGTPASVSNAKKTRPIYLQMGAVRKGLCVRILNTFSDGNNTAYTVWVYDCEAEIEFYAPVRYYEDFVDLRAASIRLIKATDEFPFSLKNWLPMVESDVVKETRRKQLEQFLRSLCAVTYKLPLHPNLVELAIHLQSFLGCDTEPGVSESNLILNHQTISNNSLYSVSGVDDGHTDQERRSRSQLKGSIQRYVYRIFLLPCIEDVATQFVDSVQSEIPTLQEMRDLERRSLGLLKERSSKILAKTQHFIDSFQGLVFEGCKEDMLSIADHDDYSSLRNRIDSNTGELYCEELFRRAIREHVEIEIYVPLRKAISTVLVNGWRHDDMSLKHKMNSLQRRPQSHFDLQQESLSGWESVIHILREGVGRSSLPCKKLRAIVDAAKEIYRLHEEEQLMSLSRNEGSSESLDRSIDKLGADDFLPMFVYCIIMADLERPCALCALLEDLCDKRARIGEVGYYFSSFQASVAYIQDMSLTDKI